jgi:hypothetical protein
VSRFTDPVVESKRGGMNEMEREGDKSKEIKGRETKKIETEKEVKARGRKSDEITKVQKCMKRYRKKNAVFWDVAPCGSCKYRRFGGMYRLHHQGDKNRRARNNVSSNGNQSISSQRASVASHRRENLKS